MRVALVGTLSDRARMRARLEPSIEVIGEFDTVGRARAAGLDVDALLLAVERREDAAEPLTDRERDVLELIAQGLPNKAVAARLGISDQTVKFHVASLIGKLGAANRTDVVRRAARRGLIAL